MKAVKQGNAALKSGTKGAKGDDCACCEECWIKPKLCGGELEHPEFVVACTETFEVIRLPGSSFCWYIDSDFTTYGAVPEGYTAVSYTLDPSEECSGCDPEPSDCNCCQADDIGLTATMYWHYTPPLGYAPGISNSVDIIMGFQTGSIELDKPGGVLQSRFLGGEDAGYATGEGVRAALHEQVGGPNGEGLCAENGYDLDIRHNVTEEVELEGQTIGTGDQLVGDCRSVMKTGIVISNGSESFGGEVGHLDLLIIYHSTFCFDGSFCVEGDADADGDCV